MSGAAHRSILPADGKLSGAIWQRTSEAEQPHFILPADGKLSGAIWQRTSEAEQPHFILPADGKLSGAIWQRTSEAEQPHFILPADRKDYPAGDGRISRTGQKRRKTERMKAGSDRSGGRIW